MLLRISCSRFKHGHVTFHDGLNVVLGDDAAMNSIGKSSLLMVVDFAFGGNDLIEKTPGIVAALGHHAYDIEFLKDNITHRFTRTTSTPRVVTQHGDTQNTPAKNISIDEYTEWLSSHFDVSSEFISFRSRTSPFSRIWPRDTFDVAQPLQTINKESSGTQLDRAIKIFDEWADLEALALEQRTATARKAAITHAMKHNIVPSINARTYKENNKSILLYEERLSELKGNLTLVALQIQDALQEEGAKLTEAKDALLSEKSRVESRLFSIERNLNRVTAPVLPEFRSLGGLFPALDIEKLTKIETFHRGISSIMTKELKQARELLLAELISIDDEINRINSMLIDTASKIKAPPEIVDEIIRATRQISILTAENKFYVELKEKTREATQAGAAFKETRAEKLEKISRRINAQLEFLSNIAFSGDISKPVLSTTSSSYSLDFQFDKGTGTAFIGLILFDVALLLLGKIPYAIEDSLMFKNVSTDAIQRIITLYSKITDRQIFIALDEKPKFGPDIAKILDAHSVINLSRSNTLYNKDWRGVT